MHHCQWSEVCKTKVPLITLLWITSHCGNPGNEKTDRVAKKGVKCEQPDNEITYFEKKISIQAIRRVQRQTLDDYHTQDQRWSN